MTDFTLKLAGVPLSVRALHEATRDFCADWLCDEPPDEHVVLGQADIDAERLRSAHQDERAGRPAHEFSDSYLETLALYRKIAEVMVAHDAVVFHGCVLAVDGRAYVFTAPSGIGKTTHARYWLRMVEGAYVLNGDKPLLRMRDGMAYACGTPWRGKEGMGVSEDLPLGGICILERAEEPRIASESLAGALGMLVRQTYRPESPAYFVRCVELIGQIGTSVPLWRMGCTLDERCALVSHQAMVCG